MTNEIVWKVCACFRECKRCPATVETEYGTGTQTCRLMAQSAVKVVSQSARNQALEEAAKAVDNMRPCPFDSPKCEITPEELCPVCGDASEYNGPSNCQNPAWTIRSLKSPEVRKPQKQNDGASSP